MPSNDSDGQELQPEAPTPRQVRDARRDAHSGEKRHPAMSMSHKGQNKNQKRGEKGKASKSKGSHGGGEDEKDTGAGPR